MKKNILFILLGIFFAMNTYNISAASPRAKHVILIGLDGWGAYSVSKAEMPNVKKLMDDGSYTLKKRSVLPSSSAVNWLPCSWEPVRNFTDIPNGIQRRLNYLHGK